MIDISDIFVWLVENQASAGALVGVFAALAGLLLSVRRVVLQSKVSRVEIDGSVNRVFVKPSASPSAEIGSAPNTLYLTLEAYEHSLQKARNEVLAQIPDASGEQLQLLTAKRDEYEIRLRDIEPAYELAKARIAELEALLEREGNLLGADDLAQAERALVEGDFDAAEVLLVRIEDQGDLEVKRAARAAYGRGQIAAEQVRWLDAAA